MNLYEATNGQTGQAYVRMYIWTMTAARATELARRAYRKENLPDKHVSVTLLLTSSSPEFCSAISDVGFENETI